MPPEGFEPTIPAIARPHIYALDRAAIWSNYKAPSYHQTTDISVIVYLFIVQLNIFPTAQNIEMNKWIISE
jgi:hypothetical protein